MMGLLLNCGNSHRVEFLSYLGTVNNDLEILAPFSPVSCSLELFIVCISEAISKLRDKTHQPGWKSQPL